MVSWHKQIREIIDGQDRSDLAAQIRQNTQQVEMGFGHRVYRNYDPRTRIIKQLADDVFEVTGVNPLLEFARELERITLGDDYFVSRKL